MCHSVASSTLSGGSSRFSLNSSTSTRFNAQLPETNIDGVKYSYHWDVDVALPKSLFVMAGATNLSISCGESSEMWQWYRRDGNYEAVELQSVSPFEIRCKIKTLMLSRTTIYGAYMVYQINYSLHQAKAMIIFDNYESDADASAEVVKLGWIDDHGELTTQRKEEWIEVQLGSFYVGHGDFELVEACLSADKGIANDGLVVSGIEFRPLVHVKEA